MLNRDTENINGKDVVKNELSITELWNNFKNTKMYVDGIQQEVKDRRIEKRTS